ncbi:hypothetical protein [Amycolatopsis thermoflava]|uniref:hypothetical protein n=1 Tax=Amycolatopsis thermoflava TaxID=84480 RepID=UPI0036600413
MRRTTPSGLEVFLPHTDRDDWAAHGYRSREEYLFWSRKVCGLACLQSLLHGWTDVRSPWASSSRKLSTGAATWSSPRARSRD